MRVLLDVDGVLADFDSAAVDLVAGITGVCPEPGVGDYLACPARVTRAQLNAIWTALGQPGACFALQPYPGSKEFVGALREAGHEVVFVTSPPRTAKTWMHERTEWLIAHMGAERSDVVHTPRKYLVHGDLLIDDMKHNVHAFQSVHGAAHARQFRNVYNEAMDSEFVVADYDAALRYVAYAAGLEWETRW